MSVMTHLSKLVADDPHCKEADFEGKKIRTFDKMAVNILSRFPELEKINLAMNAIQVIPDDLSSLKNIHTINLHGNPLVDLVAVSYALGTIPDLTDVWIDLHNEVEVEAMLTHLTHLQRLNGEDVHADEMHSDASLEDDHGEGMPFAETEGQDNDLNNQSIIGGESILDQSITSSATPSRKKKKRNMTIGDALKKKVMLMVEQEAKAEGVDVKLKTETSVQANAYEIQDLQESECQTELLADKIDEMQAKHDVPQKIMEEKDSQTIQEQNNKTFKSSQTDEVLQAFTFSIETQTDHVNIVDHDDHHLHLDSENAMTQKEQLLIQMIDRIGKTGKSNKARIAQRLGVDQDAELYDEFQKIFLKSLKQVQPELAQTLGLIYGQTQGMLRYQQEQLKLREAELEEKEALIAQEKAKLQATQCIESFRKAEVRLLTQDVENLKSKFKEEEEHTLDPCEETPEGEKVLSVDQLSVVVNQVLQSKFNHNKIDSNQTMEVHLFEFFLCHASMEKTNERIMTFLHSLQHHSDAHDIDMKNRASAIDIHCISCLLHDELDEGYFFGTHLRLQNSIRLFVLEKLKESPIDYSKNEVDINKLCDFIVNGEVKVEEKIWRHVIERIFENSSLGDETDKRMNYSQDKSLKFQMLRMCQEMVYENARQIKIQMAEAGCRNQDEIKTRVKQESQLLFLPSITNTIYLQHIHAHQEYLKNFNELYVQAEEDVEENDEFVQGSLTELQLKKLIALMHAETNHKLFNQDDSDLQQQITQILVKADFSKRHGLITYSEIINLFNQIVLESSEQTLMRRFVRINQAQDESLVGHFQNDVEYYVDKQAVAVFMSIFLGTYDEKAMNAYAEQETEKHLILFANLFFDSYDGNGEQQDQIVQQVSFCQLFFGTYKGKIKPTAKKSKQQERAEILFSQMFFDVDDQELIEAYSDENERAGIMFSSVFFGHYNQKVMEEFAEQVEEQKLACIQFSQVFFGTFNSNPNQKPQTQTERAHVLFAGILQDHYDENLIIEHAQNQQLAIDQ